MASKLIVAGLHQQADPVSAQLLDHLVEQRTERPTAANHRAGHLVAELLLGHLQRPGLVPDLPADAHLGQPPEHAQPTCVH